MSLDTRPTKKRIYAFISHVEPVSRVKSASRSEPQSLDWAWLRLTIQEGTESMFEALLGIAARQGYRDANHYVGIAADSETWCRSPAADGHTKADIEFYQAIRECAEAIIQVNGSARATWLSVPKVSIIIRQPRRICYTAVRRAPMSDFY